MFDEGTNYTCDIKIFQASPDASRGVDFLSASEFPAERVVPGYLCQAARLLLGLTQQELHVLASVSKKTINDYENGFIDVRPAIAERLGSTLRGAGARFIMGKGYVGVVVRGRRSVTAKPVAAMPAVMDGKIKPVAAGMGSAGSTDAGQAVRRARVRQTKHKS